jgi:hypothetical protein
MTDASRLHRRGFMPSIGRSAAQKWMAQHATSMTASTGAADAARSADLGYNGSHTDEFKVMNALSHILRESIRLMEAQPSKPLEFRVRFEMERPKP